MLKNGKKILCILLIVIMCLTMAPLQGFVGLEWNLMNINVTAAAATYKVGDIIQFGSYPQTKVTNNTIIAALNDLAPDWEDWISYGYYSGTGEEGSLVQGDWMRYIDINYNEKKYRGVKFTRYRPTRPSTSSNSNFYHQAESGYVTDVVYWFLFEPLKWRILDPDTGLVLSETAIDAQPFNNTLYSTGTGVYDYFKDPEHTIYACDYENSYIREWLNNTFYNTAFAGVHKTKIITSNITNKSLMTSKDKTLDGNNTKDKIFLLTIKDVVNSKYGFSSNIINDDVARRARGSDYAKCQGLNVTRRIANTEYNHKVDWILRTPRDESRYIGCVLELGYAYIDYSVNNTTSGIRPAMCINTMLLKKLSSQSIKVIDADGNPVNGATVTIYNGAKAVWNSEPSEEGYVYLYGFDTIKYKNATVSAHLSLDDGLELCSEFVNYKGVWTGKQLSKVLETPVLMVSEPRWNISLSVAYAGDNYIDWNTNRYDDIVTVMNNFAKKLAQMTNGHVLLKDYTVVHAPDDASMYSFDSNGKAIHNYPADILIFENEYWPCADVNGFGKDGKHIYISYNYLDSSTLVHEAGHYLFGFFDEYCYGKMYRYDTNNDGIVCEYDDCGHKGDTADPHTDIENSGYWGNGYLVKPIKGNFGVMDEQDVSIEMSTYETYDYLNNYYYLTSRDEVDKSVPEIYTMQYYLWEESCEDHLAWLLSAKAEAYGYSTNYKRTGGTLQTVEYDYATLNSASKIVVEEETYDVGVDEESYNKAIESSQKLDGVEFALINDELCINLTNEKLKYYQKNISAQNIVSLAYNETHTITAQELFKNKYLITVIDDNNENTSKNTYKIYAVKDIDTDSIKLHNETTDYIIIVESIATAENAVGKQYQLLCNSDQYSGTIEQTIPVDGTINYNSIELIKADAKTSVVERHTANSFFGEHDLLHVKASVAGNGIYYLFAEPSLDGIISPVKNISFSKEGTLYDSQIIVNFTDENEDSMVYKVYYDKKELYEDGNSFSNCKTLSAESQSIVVNLDDFGEYVFGIQAINYSGIASEISIETTTIQEPDENTDGIPDFWFNKYYTLEDSSSVASQDPDGDSLTNLQEYELGTNPIDPDTDGDNVDDKVEIDNGLDPLQTHTDGETDDYIVVYGTPDLSILEQKPFIIEDEVVCTLTNKTDGKAIGTNIYLYIDDVLTDVWTLNVDTEYEIPFSFPVEYLSQVNNSLRIEVDEGKITRDIDYLNNTFEYIPITDLYFENEVITIIKGESTSVVPTTVPEKGSLDLLNWYITENGCISIDDFGVVTANHIGTADITVETFDGISASCTVQVIPFEGAEYTDFDSELINNGTEVRIIGYCGNDTDIIVPATIGGLPVTDIDLAVFDSKTDLRNIFVDEENTAYSSVDGVLYNKDVTELIRCPQSHKMDVFIPDTVKYLVANAFYCSDVCIKNYIDNNDRNLYHVSTGNDLRLLADLVNCGYNMRGKVVQLDNDINLSGVEWISIGNNSTPFSSVFDGNNHTISGLNYENASNTYSGLFGYIKTGGIKDLTVEGTVIGGNRVGMIAGYMLDSALYNCKAIGEVKRVGSGGYGYVGGLVGSALHSVIINCAVETDIVVDFSSSINYAAIGGLVGVASVANSEPQCILNSYCSGDITVSGNKVSSGMSSYVHYYVGGIAGYLRDDAVNNYYYGSITDTDTNSIKEIGYAFGYVAPEFTSESDYNGIGTIIVSDNYYPEGKTPIASISSGDYDTTGWTEGISDESFSKVTGEGSLVDKLNGNKSKVEEIIVTHRDVLADSAWAELVERIDGDSFTVSDWKVGPDNFPVNYDCECYSHVESDWVIDEAATCTKEGSKHTYCLICLEIVSTKAIERIGHTGGTANCKDKAVCTRCDTAYGEIDSSNHKNIVTDKAVEATCKAPGLTEGSHCEACGVVIKAQSSTTQLQHKYQSVVTAPTCTEEGYTTYTCSKCDDSYTADKVDKLGHTGGTANCKDKAVCTRCKKTYGDIDKNNHKNILTDKAVSATCKAPGLTEGSHCDACGKVIKAQTTIAKLPHKEAAIPGKAATCKETGVTEGKKCSVCGEITVAQTTIKKLDHNYVDGTCSKCGDSKAANCSHMCHKNNFIWKMLRFFFKLFKIQPVCECGVKHY